MLNEKMIKMIAGKMAKEGNCEISVTYKDGTYSVKINGSTPIIFSSLIELILTVAKNDKNVPDPAYYIDFICDRAKAELRGEI